MLPVHEAGFPPLRESLDRSPGRHVIRPECQQSSVGCSAVSHSSSSVPSGWISTRRLSLLLRGGGRVSLCPTCKPFNKRNFATGGERRSRRRRNMRSLAGLAAIVAAATVFLYLLSTHLAPGDRPGRPGSAGEDDGDQQSR